jgi:cation diffusion facilitator family transporter
VSAAGPRSLIAERAEAGRRRARTVRWVLFAILVANWAVAAAKLGFGWMSQSAAVTADGLHSLLDGGSNVLGLVAMSIAARPPDAGHPYGHGKFEALASLAIGAMVGTGGLELGKMAFDALVRDVHPNISNEMFAVMGATFVVNVIVARVELYYGK